ncbi:MAG: ABC transporter permease [Pseudomonadales bacterium]|jgi:putative ABC transport system permease protein|nr:ABC transporter permease [Pseudomonadales bacterium]
MLRDHLRSFWRGVVNNKLTTGINVAGLALGLAVFFALTFYVQREFSWDAQWQDADRIYAVAWSQESPNGHTLPIVGSGPLPYVLGTSLLSRNPDAFELYARRLGTGGTLVVDGENYSNRQLHYVEPALLDLFPLETLEGSLQAVFADPHAIAINSAVATTLFGQQTALGRVLTFVSPLRGAADYTIKAVYHIPEPSILSSIQLMTLLDPAVPPLLNVNLEDWGALPGFGGGYYFKLRPGVSAPALEAALRAFMDENHYLESGAGIKSRFSFVPLRDIHLMPSLFDTGNNVERLRVLAAIGALVLAISGCNFVMLATLRSLDRMREIGIRKTLGGEVAQLLWQYLLDVFLQTLLAALLAIALLDLCLPWLRTAMNLPSTFELWSWHRLGAGFAVVVIFTLLSGLYPALLLLRGKPATLLRNSASAVVASGNALRKLLVGIQFAIVVSLLLASAVVWQQIDYTRSHSRGYSVERVVGSHINTKTEELSTKVETLVKELKRVPGVAAAAAGALSPGIITINAPTGVVAIASDGAMTEASLQSLNAGADYFSVMSVPILAGREFSDDIDTVTTPSGDGQSAPVRNVLLNVAAARALGFATPEAAVGNIVTVKLAKGSNLRVIGVVADTQFSSPLLPPVAQFYSFSTRSSFIAVKLNPGVERAAVTEDLRKVWQQVLGDVPFDVQSPEELGDMLQREAFEAHIVTSSAMLALAIALLGLYGLVGATVAKRVKEIGVRKVMGAGNTAIVSLLLWQFSKPIVIANLVAWPLGYWGISRWLQRFPYQLDTGVIAGSALAASIVALLIAWLTISVMATRAASAKPVLALRYE